VSSDRSSLPCPHLTIGVDVPADQAVQADLAVLPAKPGVFTFEDSGGGTLALATTSNLRRTIASRLRSPDAHAGRTRRVDYRSLVRTVLAVPVGSAFEADWAYLQLARIRLPNTYRSLLDRWQAFFIQCDPDAAFPQFVKTVHPEMCADSTRVHLGPIADKHAAGRFIEALVDAFDLCRYHHILVQAPHGAACAYKEMGRCPAPCDGSISMDQYRATMRDAIEFARTPREQWQATIEGSMRRASADLEFESAANLQNLLLRTAGIRTPQFAHVNDLRRFAFLAVMPSERRQFARLFLIVGGWIQPIADVPVRIDDAELPELLNAVGDRARQEGGNFSRDGIENIGMVCAHLFRPRASKAPGEFLRIGDELDITSVRRALRKLDKTNSAEDQSPLVADQGIESTAV